MPLWPRFSSRLPRRKQTPGPGNSPSARLRRRARLLSLPSWSPRGLFHACGVIHASRPFRLQVSHLSCLFMKREVYYGWPLLLAVVLGGAGALPVMSQEFPGGPGTRSLTLEGAIGLALASNPRLSAAGSQVAGAAGRAYQSKLWPNPELELSAEDWPTGGGGPGAVARGDSPGTGPDRAGRL